MLAQRAARHDPAVPVRLVADGVLLAVFLTTPFGCLGLRVARLGEPANLDIVVEAVGLATRAQQVRDGLLVLPPRLPDISWALPLPPRSGWEPVGAMTTGEVARVVARDTDDFRRAATHADTPPTAAGMQRLAEEIWSRSLLTDAPVRLAHAADYLGFLSDDPGEQVAVGRAGPWRRLDARHGVTVVRTGDPLGLLVS